MKFILTFVLPLLICGNSVASAATVILTPSKDNTLYESASGAFSNGAGEYLFAGRTGFNANNVLRRAVIAFDIASAVPSDAIIDSVTLRLRVSNANPSVPQATTSLHRVLADWGEGTSDAGFPGGDGAPSTTGDATWIHRSFSATRWNAAGGDFTGSASASRPVGTFGAFDFASAQMAADVQSWLTTPSANFGWIVIGAESQSNSARRFDSSESVFAGNRPALTIVYTPIPEPAAAALVSGGLALLSIVRRRRSHNLAPHETR